MGYVKEGVLQVERYKKQPSVVQLYAFDMNSLLSSDHNYMNIEDETYMTTMNVDASDIPIVVRLKYVCEAWEEVSQREESVDQSYIHTLLCTTVRLTLSHLWKTIEICDRLALRQVLAGMQSWGCRTFACLLPNPWGSDELMDDDPRERTAPDEQSLYQLERKTVHHCQISCGVIPRVVLHARVEILCYCGFLNVALQLCLLYRQCRSHQGDYFYADRAFHLLFHSGNIKRMVEEMQLISCHDGLQLIQYILSDKGSVAHGLVECLTQILLVRDLIGPSPYCCTLPLMKTWCSLHYQQRSDRQVIIEEAGKLGALAITSAHLYLLVDVLFCQYGRQLLPLYFKLYIHALTIDINNLEYARQIDCQMSVAELETNMAGVYTKLASLLDSERGAGLARECLLTAFSLEPTLERLNELKVRAPLSSTVWRYNRTFVMPCQGECHCTEQGLCRRDNALPPWYLTDVPNGILDSTLPNVSASLLQDLCVVVEGPRCHWLSWNIPWDELCVICNNYLQSARRIRVTKDDKEVGIDARLKRLGLLDAKRNKSPTSQSATSEQNATSEQFCLANVKVEPGLVAPTPNDLLNASVENMMSSNVLQSSPEISSSDYPVLHIEEKLQVDDRLLHNPGYPLLENLEKPKPSFTSVNILGGRVKQMRERNSSKISLHKLNKDAPFATANSVSRRIAMLPVKRSLVNPIMRLPQMSAGNLFNANACGKTNNDVATAVKSTQPISSIASANPFLSSLLGSETKSDSTFPLHLLDVQFNSKPVQNNAVVQTEHCSAVSNGVSAALNVNSDLAQSRIKPAVFQKGSEFLRTLSKAVPSVNTIAMPSAFVTSVSSHQRNSVPVGNQIIASPVIANSQQHSALNKPQYVVPNVNGQISIQNGRMEVSKIHINSSLVPKSTDEIMKTVSAVANNMVKLNSNGLVCQPNTETSRIATPLVTTTSTATTVLQIIPQNSKLLQLNNSTDVKYYIHTSRGSINLVQPVTENQILQPNAGEPSFQISSSVTKIEPPNPPDLNFPKVGESSPLPSATTSGIDEGAKLPSVVDHSMNVNVHKVVTPTAPVRIKEEVVSSHHSNGTSNFDYLLASQQLKPVVAVARLQKNITTPAVPQSTSVQKSSGGNGETFSMSASRKKSLYAQTKGRKWMPVRSVHGTTGYRVVENQTPVDSANNAIDAVKSEAVTSSPNVISSLPFNSPGIDVSKLPIVKKCSPVILNCAAVNKEPVTSLARMPLSINPLTLGVIRPSTPTMKLLESWALVSPSNEAASSQIQVLTTPSDSSMLRASKFNSNLTASSVSNVATSTIELNKLLAEAELRADQPNTNCSTGFNRVNSEIATAYVGPQNIIVAKVSTQPSCRNYSKGSSASKKTDMDKNNSKNETVNESNSSSAVITSSASAAVESNFCKEANSFQASFVNSIMKFVPKTVQSDVAKQTVQSSNTTNSVLSTTSASVCTNPKTLQNDVNCKVAALQKFCLSDNLLSSFSSVVLSPSSDANLISPLLLSDRLSACVLSSAAAISQESAIATKKPESEQSSNRTMQDNTNVEGSANSVNCVKLRSIANDSPTTQTDNSQCLLRSVANAPSVNVSGNIIPAPLVISPLEYNAKTTVAVTSHKPSILPIEVSSAKLKLFSEAITASNLAQTASNESLTSVIGITKETNSAVCKKVNRRNAKGGVNGCKKKSLKSELGKFISIGQAIIGATEPPSSTGKTCNVNTSKQSDKTKKVSAKAASKNTPSKCNICSKVLTSLSNLRRHVLNVHKVQMIIPDDVEDEKAVKLSKLIKVATVKIDAHLSGGNSSKYLQEDHPKEVGKTNEVVEGAINHASNVKPVTFESRPLLSKPEVEPTLLAKSLANKEIRLEPTIVKNLDFFTEKLLKTCYVQLVRQDVSTAVNTNPSSSIKGGEENGKATDESANEIVKITNKEAPDEKPEAAPSEIAAVDVSSCNETMVGVKIESLETNCATKMNLKYDFKVNEEKNDGEDQGGDGVIFNMDELTVESVEESDINVKDDSSSINADSPEKIKNEDSLSNDNECVTKERSVDSNEYCETNLDNFSDDYHNDMLADTMITIEFEPGREPVISQQFGGEVYVTTTTEIETSEAKAVDVGEEGVVVDTRPSLTKLRGRASSRTVKPPQKRCCHCCENSTPSPTQSPKKCRAEPVSVSKTNSKISRKSRIGVNSVGKMNSNGARS